MLDWLSRLFDWLFQFVPQFVLLSPREAAVRITHVPFIRSWYRVKKFGWYMYWPLFQTMAVVEVKQQVLLVELAAVVQGKSTESSWAVRYWILNPYKAKYECEDAEEILAAHSMKVIGGHIIAGENPGQWNLNEMASEIRNEVTGIGLYIQQVIPLQFVYSRVLKLFIDNIDNKTGRII